MNDFSEPSHAFSSFYEPSWYGVDASHQEGDSFVASEAHAPSVGETPHKETVPSEAEQAFLERVPAPVVQSHVAHSQHPLDAETAFLHAEGDTIPSQESPRMTKAAMGGSYMPRVSDTVPDGFRKDPTQEQQQSQAIAETVQAWLLPCKHGNWDWVVQHLRCHATADPVLVVHPEAARHWWQRCKSQWVHQWLETWLSMFGLQAGYIKNTKSLRFKLFIWGLSQMGLMDRSRQKLIHDRKGLWVLPYGALNRSMFAYQLTHWLAEQQGLSGYSLESKKLYHQWGHRLESPAFMKALHQFTTAQTLALQAAIRREMEALRVTYELC
ncbi:MAG: hypothetical protein ACKO37_05870 [Vampirovibrionales bacterium]